MHELIIVQNRKKPSIMAILMRLNEEKEKAMYRA